MTATGPRAPSGEEPARDLTPFAAVDVVIGFRPPDQPVERVVAILDIEQRIVGVAQRLEDFDQPVAVVVGQVELVAVGLLDAADQVAFGVVGVGVRAVAGQAIARAHLRGDAGGFGAVAVIFAHRGLARGPQI